VKKAFKHQSIWLITIILNYTVSYLKRCFLLEFSFYCLK